MTCRSSRVALGAVVLFVSVSAGVADAASKRLSVKGNVGGSQGQNLAVLLVGNDGSSVRAAVSPSGSFEVKVPATLVSRMSTGSAGKGPTLHVLSNGNYAGPVVLGSSGSKGYARLSARANGTVSVGAITLKTMYAMARAKSSIIDRTRSIRMKSGKPVSSGSVREAALFGPVRSFAAVAADTGVSGADSDRDGLPNFADPDLNGDGVIDAAQPDPSSQFAGAGTGVQATKRPGGRFGFQKIIEEPEFVQVNSNANPTVTQDQLLGYLTDYMSIEMLVGLQPEEMTTVTALVDCRKLSYCSAGSKSRIRGIPGEATDGKELVTLQNAEGLLVMPNRPGEYTKLLRFYPGAASASEAALTGDVFELVMQRNGATTYSEVRVVTSSFVTPMAIRSFNGSAVNLLAHQRVVGSADPARIVLTFNRPQSFANGSTSALVDRGGMSYIIRAWPQDDSNKSYVCAADGLTGLSPTLTKGTDSAQGGGVLFDTEQTPTVNGTLLGVTVDFTKCVNKETGRAAAPVKGEYWKVEIEAQDSDWNRARIGAEFLVG